MSSEDGQQHELSVFDAIKLGVLAHRQGQLDQAEKIYNRILQVWPDCPDALHFSGLLAFNRGDLERAAALMEKSLVLVPEHPDFWNNFGNVLKALGKRSEATESYQRAIELRPEFADAHNNVGVMASQRGDFAGAVEAYLRAVEFQPTHADAYLNLGSAYERLSMLPESADAYRKVTDLRPTDQEAHGRLGHIFWRQGKTEEATEAIVRNAKVNAGDPMAYILLAGIFYDQGRASESIEAYRKAVEIAPTDNYANRLLGMTLLRCGRPEEAREVWKAWSELAPSDPIPRHLLRAGTDDDIPARAGDDFVVLEFNRFAESFDKKLKDLEYRAPEIVEGALKGRVPKPDQSLDILDAGCGTGLCGPLLRPYARRLEGVDLSPAMLSKAKSRGGYDELITAELTAFIASKADAYDVIVSADTLCYFGQLEPVFTAAFGALRSEGYFIFTLERTASSAGAARLTLDLSGRYTHTEQYVRAALADVGFTVDEVSFTTLRLEYMQPVEGMLVVARKNAPPRV